MTFYHVYADESRQDSRHNMLYGMLFIPREEPERALLAGCTSLREKHHWGPGEFKWEKVSKKKLHVYKEFVDVFFAQPNAEFRCLVVDQQKINYKIYHQGDKETAFYEFYFQAISRNLRLEHEYLIYTDDRNNRQPERLVDMKAKINYHWLTKGAKDNIVRNIEARNFKESDQVQLTDVLLGAVGYDLEERAESPAKVELVKYIAERIGCERLRDHWGRDTNFNIWKFRFPEEVEKQK